MPNRSQEERMVLSRFDTVFLFSFTVITVVLSLLSALIGPLRGLLPILVLLITVYPFYIGVWHGIMNDKVAERLFAWEYIVFQFIYLATVFVSAFLFTQLPFDIVLSIPFGDFLALILKLLTILVVFFVMGKLIIRMFVAIRRVFRQNLPSLRQEISKKEYGRTCRSHSLWASLFQSITVMIALFAIQEWELAIGIITYYPIPYSFESLPYVAGLFVFVWYCTYQFIMAE